MRKWIDLAEGQFIVTVFHGDEKNNFVPHRRSFFSTCEEFARDYGSYLTKWQLDVSRIVDSLDGELIEPWLPLRDTFDDTEIETLSDYMDRSSDTWEMIEPVSEHIVSNAQATGIIIYEGGIANYLIYDVSCLRAIEE